MPRISGVMLLALTALLPRSAVAAAPLTSAELFQPAKIWTAHFTISPEQWKLMQPRLGPPPPYTGPDDVPLPNRWSERLGWVFAEAHAELDFEGTTLSDVAVRYKGNGSFFASRNTLKISLKVDLNKNTKGQKLAGETNLEFHANVRDASGMNETLAMRLYRAVGVEAPRTTYARVYLTVPGQLDRKYLGLYSLLETVDRNFTETHLGTRSTAILKPTVLPNSSIFGYRGTDWSRYENEWDPKTDLTVAQKQRVIDFTALVTSAPDAEFAARIGDFLEVSSFARQMAVVVWITNIDGLLFNNQNIYVVLDPRTNRLRIVPWDQDEAWGANFSSIDANTNMSIYRPWAVAPQWLLVRLFRHEAFRREYFATLARLTLELARPEQLARQVDELARILRPAYQEESAAALARFDIATADGVVPRLIASISTPTTSAAPYLSIKAFSRARERSVLEQLLEP